MENPPIKNGTVFNLIGELSIFPSILKFSNFQMKLFIDYSYSHLIKHYLEIEISIVFVTEIIRRDRRLHHLTQSTFVGHLPSIPSSQHIYALVHDVSLPATIDG